jgi:cytochrome b involved in lipid metabolism
MNKSILAVISVSIVIIIGGIAIFLFRDSNNEPTTDTTKQSSSQTTVDSQTYSGEEVAQHATRTDCWMIIEQKVYDVTEFINSHPGGSAILEGCGIDATSLFFSRPMGSGTPHSSSAQALLGDYYLGELE